MALIDDIIEIASNDKEPIGNLLRKCLILERQIPNEKFRAWLDNELDGYEIQDELPSYRVFNCVNKGTFVGLAVQLNDQPLSLHVMEPKDRKLIEKGYLAQPAASYIVQIGQRTHTFPGIRTSPPSTRPSSLRIATWYSTVHGRVFPAP